MTLICSTFIPTMLFIIFFILSWKNEYHRNYKMADLYNELTNIVSIVLVLFTPINILLSLFYMLLGHLLLGFSMILINIALFYFNLFYIKKVIRNSVLYKTFF